MTFYCLFHGVPAGCKTKFSRWLALILAFSPGEKEKLLNDCVYRQTIRLSQSQVVHGRREWFSSSRVMVDSARTVPYSLAVFIDFPNAVEGDAMVTALRVCEAEDLWVVFGESYFSKGDDDDTVLHAVKVAQFELPTAKFGVPADAVEQFADGGHCRTFSFA
jgi:hypothetical protein